MINTIPRQEEATNSQSGFTLIEMIVSILVGTIVITILMQQLVMTVQIKRDFEYDNRLSNESYVISEQAKFNIFNLEPHSIEVIEDSATQTIIHILHEYDITSGAGNIIVRDYSSPVTDILIWNKTTQVLTYEFGATSSTTNLHSSNILILNDYVDSEGVAVTGSSFTITRIDPTTCLTSPSLDICGEGILKLDLLICVQLEDGSLLEPQRFVTTIII